MPKLTVFTATYNRAHLLERLYRSLQRQSVFDFEWLVIDDGSTDNTADLFLKWQSEKNPFVIRFFTQENQGLIRTLNRGIQLAHGVYFSKIDSDDYVVDDYMENMSKWLDNIRSEPLVYGVGGVRVRPDGIPIKGSWPKIESGKYVDATDLERKEYNLDADMSEAWRTDILRQHPFPVWPGEKFAPEQIVFHEIALEGFYIRWHPVPMCICEYQEGGLTLGASKLEKENPMGYAMMYNHKLKYLSAGNKLRAAIQMGALCFVGKHPSYLFKSNAKFLTLLTILPAFLLSLRRYLQYKQ